MNTLNQLLSPILASVVEQMLNDGSPPALVAEAVLEASLAKTESDLSSLAGELMDISDKIASESDRWLSVSSGSRLSDSDSSDEFEAYNRSLALHDEVIKQLHGDQKEIEEKAAALVANEMAALSLLERLREPTQAAGDSTQETTEHILKRCVKAHDPFECSPNPSRYTHVLRSLIDIGRIGLLPHTRADTNKLVSSTASGPLVLSSNDLEDDIPF